MSSQPHGLYLYMQMQLLQNTITLKSATSSYPRIPLCFSGPCEGKPCPFPLLLPIIWRGINAGASGQQRQECQSQMNLIQFLITTQFSQCHLFKFPPQIKATGSYKTDLLKPDSLSSSVLLVREVIKVKGCEEE